MKVKSGKLLGNLFRLMVYIYFVFMKLADWVIMIFVDILIIIYIFANAEIIKKEQITGNKQVIELKKSIDNYFK